MNDRHRLPVTELPTGFSYPTAYLSLVDRCRPDTIAISGLPPWVFAGNLPWALQESPSMFGRTLVPFAQAAHQDLLAYFVADGTYRIVVTNPWEQDERFRFYRELPDFNAWLAFASAYSADFLAENPHYRERLAWFPHEA